MNANKFVFVVCGGREHIDTLHFSVRALKKFSRNEVIVVTDTTRNEAPVVHDQIIDIKTPQHFNHHQASIYLKTGLNKFLEKGNNYCYLDTDVVALDDAVDEIFEKYTAPVTFCTDHCGLNEFSPSAIYCGCWEAFQRDSEKIQHYLDEFNNNILPGWLYIDKCLEEIERLVAQSKVSKWNYRWHQLKYFMPGRYYRLNSRYKMDKEKGLWYDENGVMLKYGYDAKDPSRYISKNTGFKYDKETKKYYRVDGISLPARHCCAHLEEKLSEKFGIHVHPSDWQHWNGGVFLFNDESSGFLEFWHNATIAIFEDKEWRTRDQGTLIATAWQFGLMDHVTLPIAYNLIADYNSETYDSDKIEYLGNLTFNIGIAKKTIKPHFIHLYHHWGDAGWHVWRDVEKHITG
jgi:hypothetical protein